MRYSVEQIPHEMKVPFTMRKCPSARLILYSLTSCGLDSKDLLDDYAYSVSGEGMEKMFYAERYGGHGMFSNGGGVRCGLTGRFQVKGIGINPLRGRSTPASYSTGVMNLVEAVREFVWAKIFKASMPHQSPDVVAVMSLEGTSPKSEHDDQPYTTIRESISRIASLERAFHFKPRDEDLMYHDSLRVKAAIEIFASGNFNRRISARSQHFSKHFLEALIDLAAKQAEQYAAAKVRRIMHGALTGSNCCIDGGWLDFGSIDHLPSFATTPNFIFGFWGENQYLFESIKSVCHSAELNSLGMFNGNEGLNHFTSQFARTYEECLVKNFCYLLGLDENFVTKSPTAAIRHLVNISRRIAAAAFNSTPHQSNTPESLLDHPSKSGLSLAFHCAQVIGCSDDKFLRSQFSFMDDGLLADLLAVSSAYEAYALNSGIPKENAFQALITTSARRTTYLSALNSIEMNRQIKSFSASETNLKKYVAMLIAEATVAFKARPGWNTEIGSINGNIHFYRPSSGMVQSVSGEELSINAWHSLAKTATTFTKTISDLTESIKELP